MNLSETYATVTESFANDGIETSDVVKAGLSCLASPITSLYKGISNGVSNTASDIADVVANRDGNDNVYISVGTKTLIGQDFESLYASHKIKTFQNSDGTSSDYIVSTCDYYTEMSSGNASSNAAWSYDQASGNKVKAVYEITLLSKKYSSQYEQGNDVKNAQLETEYADYMSQYREFCEANDISWDDVMTGVSAELQTQTWRYIDQSDNLFKGKRAEENRVIVNRAHSMLKGCMSEGYTDQLLPSLAGKMTYEDTLDTDPRDVNFFINIGHKFAEMWSKVKDKIPHPFKAMKETVTGYVTHLAAVSDAKTAERERAKGVVEPNENMSEIDSTEMVESVVDSNSTTTTQNAPVNDSVDYGERVESDLQDILPSSDESQTIDEEFVQ